MYIYIYIKLSLIVTILTTLYIYIYIYIIIYTVSNRDLIIFHLFRNTISWNIPETSIIIVTYSDSDVTGSKLESELDGWLGIAPPSTGTAKAVIVPLVDHAPAPIVPIVPIGNQSFRTNEKSKCTLFKSGVFLGTKMTWYQLTVIRNHATVRSL